MPQALVLPTEHKECFPGADAGARFAEGTGMGWGTNITPCFSELLKRQKEKWHFGYQYLLQAYFHMRLHIRKRHHPLNSGTGLGEARHCESSLCHKQCNRAKRVCRTGKRLILVSSVFFKIIA